jgi:hypothetical protein
MVEGEKGRQEVRSLRGTAVWRDGSVSTTVKEKMMRSDWVSITTALPAHSAVWQVTRTTQGERIVDEGMYLHPTDPTLIKSQGVWLEPGWYGFMNYEPMPDVVAWMPLPCPFDGQGSAYPVKARAARPGDIVTSVRVLAGRKRLLNMELEGGEPVDDVLQLDSFRMAIDTLAEAMCPSGLDDVEIRLLAEDTRLDTRRSFQNREA